VLVANAFFYYRAALSLTVNEAWVSHTHEVIGAVEQILSLAKDLESGQRGYLITGNSDYLTPFLEAKDEINKAQDHARDLVRDNPHQEARLDRIRTLVDAKIAELDRTILVRQESGEDQARKIVDQGKGKALMDQLREVIQETADEELSLLVIRTKSTRQAQQQVTFTIFVATGLGLLLLALVYTTSSRQLDTISRQAADLARREKLFRTVTEAVSDIVWTTNANGAMQGEQPGWRAYTGQSHVDYQSYGWTKAVHPDDAQSTIDAWKTAVRERRPLKWEHRVRNRDGEYRLFSIQAVPVKNDDGSIWEWVGVHSDITVRRKTEQVVLQSEKLASVGRMAATLAHEINNPLEAVGNLIYLALTDKSVSPTIKRRLELAEQELARVSHMTKQTLGFYRHNPSSTSVDVKELAEGLLVLYASKFRAKNILLQCDFRSSGKIDADPAEIRQVVSNLLVNSIDAVPPKGHVTLRISNASYGENHSVGLKRRVRITVADNGAGIPKANLARVFEPFFTTKKDVGTGLGLFVSKEIIEKHKGSIRIRSQVNHGTVVSVSFPESANKESPITT